MSVLARVNVYECACVGVSVVARVCVCARVCECLRVCWGV